jgi:hypothetical protein
LKGCSMKEISNEQATNEEEMDDVMEAEFLAEENDLKDIRYLIEKASVTLEDWGLGRQATWTEHEQMSLTLALMMQNAKNNRGQA